MENESIEDLSINRSKFSTCSSIVVQQKTITADNKCKICGASARYRYYGAIACQSCKVFFRRNANGGQAILKCHSDNQCDIDVNNRHTCSFCRLKKCFSSGMCSEMIRSSRPKKNNESEKKQMISHSTSTNFVKQDDKNQPKQILTVNLLQSDQSTLTVGQWNLLSNLVHCFDEYSGYSFIEHFIQDQNTLPVNLRFQYLPVTDFCTSIMNNAQFVFEKNRDFLILPLHDRLTLLRTTIQYTTSIGGMFMIRQHHLFDYPSFYKSVEIIFRSTAVAFAKCAVDQFDQDDTVIKLILAIFAFSTINCTVYTECNPMNFINTKAILTIQNIYVELLWRYLLYRYNHFHAVIRFSNLIRCLFFVNNAIVEAQESSQFNEIIDTVIEQTKQKFCL